jgi:Protein of unknown function (DUF3443)
VRKFFVSVFLATLALAAGCGGTSSSTSTSTSSSSSGSSSGSASGSNVLSISVNGGPTANAAGGAIYSNGAFASATICAPGSTTNCVTVDNLLVDTGSTGLRVLQSAVASLSLPTVNASSGSTAYDCVSFVDGSYLWGPVQQADVSLGGETASKLPIQVISSSTSGIPSSCSNGSPLNENTQASLGANGILGVGSEPTDCFYAGTSACDPSSGLSSPPYPAYYTCSGTSCSPAFVSTADQVTNPVVLFPTDNNGVIVELPSVSGAVATLTGSLIFGIGTESNNQLSSTATVFTLSCDDFTTNFENNNYGITNANTCAGPGSFIDSGSNGLFFPNAANIPLCPSNTLAGDLSSFYCPTSTESFSATNSGASGTSKTTSFSVANAETLFTTTSTASDAAVSGLAGPNPTGVGFDWGLPFFYGVNVYSSIDGQSMPSGEPAAPWWAY